MLQLPASYELYGIAAALGLALTAAITDWRKGEIPNWLTLPPLVVAPVVYGILLGKMGAIASVLGIVFCGLPTLVLWWQGGIGGGDVKLVAAIGATAGLMAGLEIELVAFVVAALYALNLGECSDFQPDVRLFELFDEAYSQIERNRGTPPEMILRSDCATEAALAVTRYYPNDPRSQRAWLHCLHYHDPSVQERAAVHLSAHAGGLPVAEQAVILQTIFGQHEAVRANALAQALDWGTTALLVPVLPEPLAREAARRQPELGFVVARIFDAPEGEAPELTPAQRDLVLDAALSPFSDAWSHDVFVALAAWLEQPSGRERALFEVLVANLQEMSPES